jgi:hypothetical protein
MLRLDDAFRQFLAERGAKVVPVDSIANLFTGANRIRLAAFTLASQPVHSSDAEASESLAVAGAVLRDSYASCHRWYEQFGEFLSNRREALDAPPDREAMLHEVLTKSFEDARAKQRSGDLRETLRMLWVDELLEIQRQVQVDLANAAVLFIRRPKHILI